MCAVPGPGSVNDALQELKVECLNYMKKIGALRHARAKVPGSGSVTIGEVNTAFQESIKEALVDVVQANGKRLDGRALDQSREVQVNSGVYKGER